MTHYAPGPGIPELRAAVAEYHRGKGVPCADANVLVTPTKHAVLMSILAAADKGDEILVPDPGWVSYAPMAQWAHAKPVPVPLSAQDGFGIQADAVAAAITNKTRAIILNSPSNPTGAVDDAEEVRAVAELAADHDLWIISDEIYQEILYEGTHLSPASLDGLFERTIIVDGLSKSFAMTGWRLGWAVAPEPMFKQLNKLQSHSVTHCATFAQYGGLAALTGPREPVIAMREAFRKRRQIMLEGLRAMDGVEVSEPKGAFYCFPRFTRHADDAALCLRFIEEAQVACTPGSAFGERGRGHVRMSYATSEANIRAGLAAIAKVVAS
jgi:aspartate aminotransferase